MKSKKGVSSIIGYILLIAFVVTISGIVFVWMKGYVPQDLPECPEDISLSVEASCNAGTLEIILDNNGLFDISGYYIKGFDSDGVLIEIVDKFYDLVPNKGDELRDGDNFIIFNELEFGPDHVTKTHTFTPVSGIASIEVTPLRADLEGTQYRVVSCGDAAVQKDVVCEVCAPACTGKECGPDDCGGTCGTCNIVAGKTCDATGQCIDPITCPIPPECALEELKLSCEGTYSVLTQTCEVDINSCPAWNTGTLTSCNLADGETCLNGVCEGGVSSGYCMGTSTTPCSSFGDSNSCLIAGCTPFTTCSGTISCYNYANDPSLCSLAGCYYYEGMGPSSCLGTGTCTVTNCYLFPSSCTESFSCTGSFASCVGLSEEECGTSECSWISM